MLPESAGRWRPCTGRNRQVPGIPVRVIVPVAGTVERQAQRAIGGENRHLHSTQPRPPRAVATSCTRGGTS